MLNRMWDKNTRNITTYFYMNSDHGIVKQKKKRKNENLRLFVFFSITLFFVILKLLYTTRWASNRFSCITMKTATSTENIISKWLLSSSHDKRISCFVTLKKSKNECELSNFFLYEEYNIKIAQDLKQTKNWDGTINWLLPHFCIKKALYLKKNPTWIILLTLVDCRAKSTISLKLRIFDSPMWQSRSEFSTLFLKCTFSHSSFARRSSESSL